MYGAKRYNKKRKRSDNAGDYKRNSGWMSRGPSVYPGFTRAAGYYGRPELKFFDTTVTSTGVSATGTILSTSLNLIPEGTTESNRIGRKCLVTSVSLIGSIELPGALIAAHGDATDIVRFIVYVDKQCNGATATVADLLENATFRSHYNLANESRFRILSDTSRSLNANVFGSTNFGDFEIPLKYKKKLKVPVEFDSTTGALTEVRSNNIGVLAISRFGLAAITYDARVRFSG